MIPLDTGARRPDILGEFRTLYRQRYGERWNWTPKHLYGVEYVWIIETVEKLIGDVRGKRVLDAGGGASALSAYFAARGAIASVADRRPEPFAVSPPIAAITADLTELPQLEPFDVIVSCSAIEHNAWLKICTITRELLLRLKLGALLIVTVPADSSRKYHAEDGWPPPYRHYPECYLFDHAALRDLAESVIDLAALETPTLDDISYRAAVTNLYAEMHATTGMQQTPYLSMGFVFRRTLK